MREEWYNTNNRQLCITFIFELLHVENYLLHRSVTIPSIAICHCKSPYTCIYAHKVREGSTRKRDACLLAKNLFFLPSQLDPNLLYWIMKLCFTIQRWRVSKFNICQQIALICAMNMNPIACVHKVTFTASLKWLSYTHSISITNNTVSRDHLDPEDIILFWCL